MQAVPLGFRCNNACRFCAQGSLRAGDAGTDDAIVRERIRDALATTSAIAFVGGEPTLHDGLLGWIRAAREAGADWVLVQTNGRRLAYASWARALAEAGASAVEIALHGSTAAMHEWHTGVEGSFAQTARGIANARAAGLAVGVGVVITRSNFRHLAEIVRLAHAGGASAVRLAPAMPAGRALASAPSVVAPAELARPHVAAAVRVARALGVAVEIAGAPATPGLERRFAGLGTVEPRSAQLAARRAEVRHLPVAAGASAPPRARAVGS